MLLSGAEANGVKKPREMAAGVPGGTGQTADATTLTAKNTSHSDGVATAYRADK